MMKKITYLVSSFIILSFWSCTDEGIPTNSNCINELNCENICENSQNENIDCNIKYSLDIQPIFNNYCTSCHGNASGLDLSSYENMIQGSNNGEIVIPFNYNISELWIKINSGQMPPGDINLNIEEINLIITWINEGAYNN